MAPVSTQSSTFPDIIAGQVGIPTLSRTACTRSVAVIKRRRQISPSNGRALEILGHAIEYLADEFALDACNLALLSTADPRLRSIQILMAASRNVYYDCPIAPSLVERLRALLRHDQSTAAL
jgi:hypothetical protein